MPAHCHKLHFRIMGGLFRFLLFAVALIQFIFVAYVSPSLANNCVDGASSNSNKFKSTKFDIDNDGCLDFIEAYGAQFTAEITVNYGYVQGEEPKPPSSYILGDVGYAETRSFIKFTQDGTIDFCREIGNRGQKLEDRWISCNKLSANSLSDPYRLPIKDLGYPGSSSWKTDTKYARYCRTVGNPPNIEKKCAVLQGKILIEEYETYNAPIAKTSISSIIDSSLLVALKSGDGSAMKILVRAAIPSWLPCQQLSQTAGICNHGISGLTQFSNGFQYQFDVQSQRASLNVVLIAGQNADHAVMKAAAATLLSKHGMSGSELDRCVGDFKWGGIQGNPPFVFQKKDSGMNLLCRSGYLSCKQYQINFIVEKDKAF